MKNSAQRIMDLFLGSETTSGTHGTPLLDDTGVKWAIKKTARTLREPVTLELWEQHLRGERPLGVIPIRADSMCLWGSIDIDQYDIDLLDVVARVEKAKLPLVPCRSKSGGLHLFMFMSDWTSAEVVQGSLRDVAASLGFAGSEIFPKQTKILASQGEQGNWIIMPYFGSDYGGKLKFQYGLKKTGAEMTLDEFLTLAEKRRVKEEDLAELKLNKPKGGGKKANGESKAPKAPFGNGPPCLQHMAEGGFPLDGRKRAIFMIGIFLKKAHPNDWKEKLDQDNQTYMRPPLPHDEITSVIRSLDKKDYQYTCKEQPMAGHCNSVACRGRKFGVGTGGEYPVIEAISKLDTDPPLWFVDIPGAHISMTTEELTNYRKFHTLCVARGKPPVAFKLIRDDVWMGILNDALQTKVTIIEAGPDVGTSAVFHEMLEEFLTNRTKGERREDLLRGAPWENEDEGRHYFRLQDLMKFLARQGSKMHRNEVTTRIKEDYEGDTRQFPIKGKANINAWWVMSKFIAKAPTLEPPENKEDVI